MELFSLEEEHLPAEFTLKAAHPNPFNLTTLISYSTPIASHISLKLYNLAGRKVRTLVEENQIAGTYQVVLKAGELASGLYFVRLNASEQVHTQKLMLIR